MNEFTTIELAEAILQEKTAKIKPENIRHNIQVFDIIGTYKGDTGASYAPTNLAPFTGLGTNSTNDYTYITDTTYKGYNLDAFDVEHLDTSKVKRLYYTFYWCSYINTLRGLTNWDVSNVTGMRYTFGSKPNLTSIDELNNWKPNNCTYFYSVISGLKQMNITPITKWDINNASVHSFISGVGHYDLSGYANRDFVNMTTNLWMSFSNQQNLDNMYNCNFYNCNLYNAFSFGNIMSMPEISTWYFENCSMQNFSRYQPRNFQPNFTMNGKDLNLYGMWGVTNSSYTRPNMISTGNYNVDNVTTTFMFANAPYLTTVENISFTRVNSMYNMFCNCYNLRTLGNMNISIESHNGYGGSSLGNMSCMFHNCTRLTDTTCMENWRYIDNVSTGDTTPINISLMFCNCNNLTNDSLSAICNFFCNIRPYLNNSAQRNLYTNNANSAFYGTNINLRSSLSADMVSKITSAGYYVQP